MPTKNSWWKSLWERLLARKGDTRVDKKNLGANLQDLRNRLYFLRFSGKWTHARDESEGNGKSDLRARGSAKQLLLLLIAQHALNSPSFSWIRQKLTDILQVYFMLFMKHFFCFIWKSDVHYEKTLLSQINNANTRESAELWDVGLTVRGFSREYTRFVRM